jgi:hypothetical protein
MRVIALIEDQQVIKTILSHLGLWETQLVGRSATRVDSNHDPPQTVEKPVPAFETDLTIDESYSQLPLIDYFSLYFSA